MKYFAEVPYIPPASNKLQTAVIEALREYDRFIFSINMLPVVKSSIENVVASLNKQFPRCGALQPRWSEKRMTASNTPDNITTQNLKQKDIHLFLSANTYSCYLELKLAREESDL